MWPQLALEPGNVHDYGDTMNAAAMHAGSQVCVLLRPAFATCSSKNPAARLVRGAPFADVRPPDGITQCTMDKVEFFIDIEEALSTSKPGLSDQLPTQLPTPPVSQKGSTSQEDDILEDMIMREDSSELATWNSAYSDETQQRSSLPLTSATLTLTVNAILRFMTQDEMPVSPKCVKLRSDLRVATLQGIGPSIWKPRYLASVAERSCYLPTLSRVLSRRLSDSQLRQLTALNGQQGEGQRESRPRAVGLDDSQESLKRRLWSILQGGIPRKRGDTPLKPLKAPKPVAVGQERAADDMLDDAQVGAASQLHQVEAFYSLEEAWACSQENDDLLDFDQQEREFMLSEEEGFGEDGDDGGFDNDDMLVD